MAKNKVINPLIPGLPAVQEMSEEQIKAAAKNIMSAVIFNGCALLPGKRTTKIIFRYAVILEKQVKEMSDEMKDIDKRITALIDSATKILQREEQ